MLIEHAITHRIPWPVAPCLRVNAAGSPLLQSLRDGGLLDQPFITFVSAVPGTLNVVAVYRAAMNVAEIH